MYMLEIGIDQVARLVEELKSPHDAESAALKLIACGPSAINQLRAFLLFGTPSNVFQSRCLAVQILGRLQAKEVLVEFLRSENEIADPEVRLGEDAVKEMAARELAPLRGEDVFVLLLDLICKRPLAGYIEAIAEFKRPEAIPYLIKALEDDVCNPAAEEALRKVYPSARRFLMTTIFLRLPDSANEAPSSIRRRRSASRLLSGGGISVKEWFSLAALIDERDLVIFTAISSLGAALGSTEEKEKIANRMLDLLPGIDWSLQDEFEKVLVHCFAVCKSRIDKEILSRTCSSETKMRWDPVLKALQRIKQTAEEQNHNG
jgi:hypothetical protein